MPNLQLSNLVQQLRLSGISDSLEGRLRQARDAAMAYEELLLMLLQDELAGVTFFLYFRFKSVAKYMYKLLQSDKTHFTF